MSETVRPRPPCLDCGHDHGGKRGYCNDRGNVMTHTCSCSRYRRTAYRAWRHPKPRQLSDHEAENE